MAEETKQQEAEQPEKTYSAAEYTALQEQLDAARTSLKETAEKLSSFEKMDIDGIKASVEEYKQKLTQAEAERAAFEYRTKMNQYVKKLGLKNDVYEKHVTDLLTEKNLQFDGDTLIGGDDIVNAFGHPTRMPLHQIRRNGQPLRLPATHQPRFPVWKRNFTR